MRNTSGAGRITVLISRTSTLPPAARHALGVAVAVAGIADCVLVAVAVAWTGVFVGVRLAVADGFGVSVDNCSITLWVVILVDSSAVGVDLIGKQAWKSRTKMIEIAASLGTSSVYHKKLGSALD